jgi:predicted aspartyl protease
MIRGRFDKQGQPTLPVKLTGPYGTLEVILVVDTGFSSDVCIPMQIAIALGLPLKGHDFIELADGSINKEFVFRGNAQIGNLPPRDVDVYLTESEYGLIGAGMFQDMKLEIDYGRRTVALKPTRGEKGRYVPG